MKTTTQLLAADPSLLVALTDAERATLLSFVLGTVEAVTVHATGPVCWKLDPTAGWRRA